MRRPCDVCGRDDQSKYAQCCEYHDGYVCADCLWLGWAEDEDGGGTCTQYLPFKSPFDSVEDMAAELREMIVELSR